MIDRINGPVINEIKEIDFPDYQIVNLANGIPIFFIPGQCKEVVKIEFIFESGRIKEDKKGVSKLCHLLMREGTSQYSSKQIAETLDYYGATLKSESGMDSCGFTLYCLTKHLNKILPVILDIISHPLFSEEEIKIKKKQLGDSLKHELSKNEVIAYRALTEDLFGLDHPYGYNTTEEILNKVGREDLISFHQKYYKAEQLKVFISGDVNQEVEKQIESLSNIKSGEKHVFQINHPEKNIREKRIKGPHKYQSALRLGRILFDKQHEDFIDSYFYNTVLGGYFGSRLMQNIREQNAFTYGIYSSLDTFLHTGFFCISTEVDNEFVDKTLMCVRDELLKLQEQLMSDAELKMVQNYLLGNFLSYLDGPFKTGKLLRSFVLDGLDEKHFEKLVTRVRQISAKDVQNIANKYFSYEDLNLVVVGQ